MALNNHNPGGTMGNGGTVTNASGETFTNGGTLYNVIGALHQQWHAE